MNDIDVVLYDNDEMGVGIRKAKVKPIGVVHALYRCLGELDEYRGYFGHYYRQLHIEIGDGIKVFYNPGSGMLIFFRRDWVESKSLPKRDLVPQAIEAIISYLTEVN